MSSEVYLFLVRDNIIINCLWLGGSAVSSAIYRSRDKRIKSLRLEEVVSFRVTKEAILNMYTEGDINYIDSPERDEIAKLDSECCWQLIVI